ncbi:MAG TPA: trigger factor [Eubacterium sp.]|jgi:trigger factor|nr:trigger factor [Eubacterium sp.]
MSFTVDKLEKNMVKLTIEVDAEEFAKGMEAAYEKNKNKISVPGFRKGKVPKQMIEKMYGAGIFYEDAANAIIPKEYQRAAVESGLDIVSQPEIDVTQIEEGKNFIFTATVAVRPEVTLGTYKGVEIAKVSTEVTDEDLEAEIKKVQEQNARIINVEDRPVQDKDDTVIDFEGFMNGVPFAGGKGENYSLTIGSHSFIDTFEEQLIGKKIGEETEVNVTFPEEYHAAELAGKPATFKVTVKEIKSKELPELNDELVQDISEFKTVDEYKADLKATLEKKKAKDAEVKKENEAIEAVVANAAMEIPEAMIKQQALQMADGYDRNLKQQGISLEQYVKMMGMEIDKFIESIYPEAEKRIKNGLVLDAIAKAEDFTVTDEEVEEEIKNMASMYNMKEDELKDMMTDNERNQIKEDLAVQKAVKLIAAEAVEK